VTADVKSADLLQVFRGADAVVPLAWLIQPARDSAGLRRANVDGSGRVFRAAAEAGVPILLYASSVGAYSPGPKDHAVDESWPTDGIASSFYARHKAEVERLLDAFEREHPGVRTVRLRPGLIFKRDAASEIRRYFAGPFLPSPLIRPELVPLVPNLLGMRFHLTGLRFQAVHSLDVAEAFRRALLSDAHGAFNLAADPVLDPDELGRLLGARPVPMPAAAVRSAVKATFALHLQPTSAGWLDMALAVPIMDAARAHRELGWSAEYTSGEALLDLIEGLRDRAGLETPPLAPGAGGPLRLGEIATGVGSR
jgi:UDP-glucose 4-epimerase